MLPTNKFLSFLGLVAAVCCETLACDRATVDSTDPDSSADQADLGNKVAVDADGRGGLASASDGKSFGIHSLADAVRQSYYVVSGTVGVVQPQKTVISNMSTPGTILPLFEKDSITCADFAPDGSLGFVAATMSSDNGIAQGYAAVASALTSLASVEGPLVFCNDPTCDSIAEPSDPLNALNSPPLKAGDRIVALVGVTPNTYQWCTTKQGPQYHVDFSFPFDGQEVDATAYGWNKLSTADFQAVVKQNFLSADNVPGPKKP